MKSYPNHEEQHYWFGYESKEIYYPVILINPTAGDNGTSQSGKMLRFEKGHGVEVSMTITAKGTGPQAEPAITRTTPSKDVFWFKAIKAYIFGEIEVRFDLINKSGYLAEDEMPDPLIFTVDVSVDIHGNKAPDTSLLKNLRDGTYYDYDYDEDSGSSAGEEGPPSDGSGRRGRSRSADDEDRAALARRSQNERHRQASRRSGESSRGSGRPSLNKYEANTIYDADFLNKPRYSYGGSSKRPRLLPHADHASGLPSSHSRPNERSPSPEIHADFETERSYPPQRWHGLGDHASGVVPEQAPRFRSYSRDPGDESDMEEYPYVPLARRHDAMPSQVLDHALLKAEQPGRQTNMTGPNMGATAARDHSPPRIKVTTNAVLAAKSALKGAALQDVQLSTEASASSEVQVPAHRVDTEGDVRRGQAQLGVDMNAEAEVARPFGLRRLRGVPATHDTDRQWEFLDPLRTPYQGYERIQNLLNLRGAIDAAASSIDVTIELDALLKKSRNDARARNGGSRRTEAEGNYKAMAARTVQLRGMLEARRSLDSALLSFIHQGYQQ